MNNRISYNPDVLSCLANLSNDEVFTPPQLANQMLDMLPQELFQSPDTRFLDPCTKSGVFLREIAKRLIAGLADKIPDQQERIDHIMHHQLYGIAITRLTAMMSRRSLYCSKDASGKYSISQFDNEEGNVRYRDIRHSWVQGKCRYCGASQEVYDRGSDLESHAYEFIHTDNPNTLYNNMTFDVIIGNPPYQMSTAGSVESQATPIYHKFVEQAIKLSPRYLCMITPARWLNGGFGLDSFRSKMLTGRKICVIHDYMDSQECFPGVDISGGICYFLWSKEYHGDCLVYTHRNGKFNCVKRPLLEKGLNTFIRENDAVSILKKTWKDKVDGFDSIVSPRDPFGLNYYENGREIMFKRIEDKPFENSIKIYYYGWLKDGLKYADRKYVTTYNDVIEKYKVMVSKAYGERGAYPYLIIGKPFIAAPETCCNMTYLVVGEYDNEKTAMNVVSYMKTRFFRFLVSIMKNTQNAYKKVYSLVPLQDFSHPWTDEELYKKYGLTDEEIQFIESMIRPME